MIVRERPLGSFELVGPHSVAIALSPEQVAALDGVRAETVAEVVRTEPLLRPVSRAFDYFLQQERSPGEALVELATSVRGRKGALRARALIEASR